MGFPSGSAVKNLPAMQEPQVWSLGGEDSLGEEMATHSSILTWNIPRTKESGGLQSMGSQSQTWLKRLSSNTNKFIDRHTASVYVYILYLCIYVCVYMCVCMCVYVCVCVCVCVCVYVCV